MKKNWWLLLSLGVLGLAGVSCGDDDNGDDNGGTGGAAAGTGGAAATTPCDPAGEGVCQNDTDCPHVSSGNARATTTTCALGCQDPMQTPEQQGMCAGQCLVMETGMTPECASCYVALVGCVFQFCATPCTANAMGAECVQCQVDNACRSTFDTCSGLMSAT